MLSSMRERECVVGLDTDGNENLVFACDDFNDASIHIILL